MTPRIGTPRSAAQAPMSRRRRRSSSPSRVARRVESAVHLGAGNKDTLVTAKDGLVVCVAPEAPGVAEQLVACCLSEVLAPDGAWRAGIGRPQRGPGGAARSFQQTKQALDIAQRLQLPGSVHSADDLLVYQVLVRDSAALTDLVDVVLEPLREARTGPGILLDTLSAYFEAGRLATVAAQELHVGVRTVTYRLHRVRELTGHSVYDPRQSFTLQVAVLGARLLGWPGES